ncbi:MAG: pilus assembly protein N-terminal domain-containing protein [Janthinobacterium lividum]
MEKKWFSFWFIGCQLMMLSFLISPAHCDTSTTLEMGRGQVLPLGQNTTEIFVANPEVADVQLNTPSIAYLFGKTPGTTTVFATDSDGKITVKMDVTVTHNLSELHKIVEQNFPGENVTFFSVPQGIVIQGNVKFPIIAKNIEEITKRYLGPKDQIINSISISNPTQVLLKVKIAEVSRSALNKLNINWSSMFSSGGKFTFGVLTGTNPLNQTVSAVSP